jgi:hypothetical protein
VRSFELCVQEVIAGNRGFCIPNPRWQGPAPAVRQPGGLRRLPRKSRGPHRAASGYSISAVGAQFLPGKMNGR